MNLGIDGRTALIMASSQGLGKACALALAAEGCQVVVNGRHAEKLGATRNEIEAASGSPMTARGADVTTGSGRAQLLKACPEPDILVTNNAGVPPLAQVGGVLVEDAVWLPGSVVDQPRTPPRARKIRGPGGGRPRCERINGLLNS